MADGATVLDRTNPPSYFKVARTDTIHRVRAISEVSWAGVPSHVVVTFRCGNLGLLDRGTASSQRPELGRPCPRCHATDPDSRGEGGRRP